MKTEEQCYGILGLGVGAPESDVKSAYRELAKKYHPDLNSDEKAQEKFLEIQQAYDSIINNQFLQSRSSQQDSGFPFGGFDFGAFGVRDFAQFSNRAFNGPENSSKTLGIPFLEACLGSTKTVSYTRYERCGECAFHEQKYGKINISSCSACGGSGKIERVMPSIHIVETCRACSGKGMEIKCSTCSGAGATATKHQVSFKINAGIEEDMVLKLAGQGNFDYRANAYGDLLIRVTIAPHATMRRNGQDIFSKIKVSYLDCILGNTVEFDTIHGKDKVDIPPLTKAGSVVKVSNAGINKTGYHIVTIDVEIPDALAPAEKKLLNKIKNSKLKS